jgi:enoyl-CoA hydratase
MSESPVLYEQAGRLAFLTLNRPAKLNAIDDALLEALDAALEEARLDDAVSLVVIRGAGRAFSVGQDLSGEGTLRTMPPDPRSKPYMNTIFADEIRRRQRLQYIYDYPKQIVAQVHGYCLAMALDIAMCCTALIAADDAIFGDPSVRMGYASPNPLWTWKVGFRRARDLLLTGRQFTAADGLRYGLVTKVVPAADLDEEILTAAEALLRSGGMGGEDHRVAYGVFARGMSDAAGLQTAWDFTSGLFALSAVQRRGFRPDEPSFWQTREERGLKAALEERDRPFRELGFRG